MNPCSLLHFSQLPARTSVAGPAVCFLVSLVHPRHIGTHQIIHDNYLLIKIGGKVSLFRFGSGLGEAFSIASDAESRIIPAKNAGLNLILYDLCMLVPDIFKN
ncbi:MAG: hypothetical protein CVV52_05675 [Spirochaetae bacterium HGW-Spirochaetae-8]|nr:MAG: hypothetical protein CVV52_05675 [Spirochaetae bacterium HGW-Spirochaetae-8]